MMALPMYEKIGKIFLEGRDDVMRNDIARALQLEHELHPLADRMDDVKLIYQACYGSQHGMMDEEKSLSFLIEEKQNCLKKEPLQQISEELYRVPLSYMKDEELQLWNHLFMMTAHFFKRDEASFYTAMKELAVPQAFMTFPKDWIETGLHHSEDYQKQYAPHYRLIHKLYVDYFQVLKSIADASMHKKHLLIGVDGRCASGKSTLAKVMNEVFSATCFHMDDYFLPPEKRTSTRLQEPGGNVDYERFQMEILRPLQEKKPVIYRPYDCHIQALKDSITIQPSALVVVEGSYAHHPYFQDAYDIRILLTCDPETQKKRLRKRSLALYDRFLTEWIPMEEHYFECFPIEEQADMLMDTSGFII